MKLRRRLAENLYSIRKYLSLSQDDLSTLCGISKNYISKIENTFYSASVDVIENLSNACHIDPCIMFSRNKIKFPKTNFNDIDLTPFKLKKGQAGICF